MDLKIFFPILISTFSLIIATLALFFSQFRRAKITLTTGEVIDVNTWIEGNFGINISISVSNEGAKLAIVSRFGLLVQAPNSEEGHLFEPLYFQKLTTDNKWANDSTASPFSVLGRSTETRQVLFRSSMDKPDEFQFTKVGKYKITVLAWTKDSFKPQATDSFSVDLAEKDAKILGKALSEKSHTAIGLRQSGWRKWRAHNLTEIEVAALKLKS